MKLSLTVLCSLPLFIACSHSGQSASLKTPTSSYELPETAKSFSSLNLETAISDVPDEASVDITHVSPGGKTIGVYEEIQVRAPERGIVGNFKIYDISENTLLFDKSIVHTFKNNKEIQLESLSEKVQTDLFTLAEKRIKDLYLLRLANNPRFAEKNIELIKRYDGYYTNEGSHRRDSIFWNNRTYSFEIGDSRAPVTMSKQCLKINNPDNKLSINGKVVYNDDRQPSSVECPSTLGLHMIYSVRGHLVFILKNLSTNVSMHEQRSYTIPVWDMSTIDAPKTTETASQ